MKSLLTISIALAMFALPGDAAAASRSGSGDASRTLAAAEALLDRSGTGGGDRAQAAGEDGRAAEGRSATLLLRELAAELPQLDRAERRRARKILQRPNRQGDEDYFGREAATSPTCGRQFCIHWSDSRRAAPRGGDADGDGIPGFVEQVDIALNRSYDVENRQLGWREPVGDRGQGARNGLGGEGQLDVYLVDLGEGVFGYAATDLDARGRRRPGYLVLDNDYRGFQGKPVELMQVTVAHEYNHILQFAYDVAADTWLFESTATWMEENVYPEVDDYLSFVKNFAKAPASPMAEPNGRRPVKIYGSAVWNHWLSARYSSDLVRQTWEEIRGVKPSGLATAAFARALAGAGGESLSAEFTEFATATAEWNSDARFPDFQSYPNVRRVQVESGSQSGKARLDHTSYVLLDIPPGTGSSLELKAKLTDGISGGVALVGRTGPKVGGEVIREVVYLPAGGRTTVSLADPSRFDRITAVAVNADVATDGRGRYTGDGARLKLKLVRGG